MKTQKELIESIEEYNNKVSTLYIFNTHNDTDTDVHSYMRFCILFHNNVILDLEIDVFSQRSFTTMYFTL